MTAGGLFDSQYCRKDFRVFVGSFILPSVGASVSVTGLKFRPVAVTFFNGSLSTSGSAQGNSLFFFHGAMDAGGNQFSNGLVSFNAQTPNVCRMASYNNRCVKNDGDACFCSMDEDGFTLTIITNPGADRIIFFTAYGGGDMRAKVGAYNISTAAAPATQDITGFLFQPDFLMVSSINSTSQNWEGNTDITFSLGCTSAQSENGCLAIYDENGANPTNNRRFLSDTRYVLKYNAAAFVGQASLNSFLEDGFRISIDSTFTAADNHYYLALGGPKFSRSQYTARAALGNFAITSLKFMPQWNFFLTGNEDLYTATDINMSIGISDNLGNQRAIGGQADHNKACPSDTGQWTETANCQQRRSEPGNVRQSMEAHVSNDESGYTINQVVGEAGTVEILVWSMRAR